MRFFKNQFIKSVLFASFMTCTLVASAENDEKLEASEVAKNDSSSESAKNNFNLLQRINEIKSLQSESEKLKEEGLKKRNMYDINSSERGKSYNTMIRGLVDYISTEKGFEELEKYSPTISSAQKKDALEKLLNNIERTIAELRKIEKKSEQLLNQKKQLLELLPMQERLNNEYDYAVANLMAFALTSRTKETDKMKKVFAMQKEMHDYKLSLDENNNKLYIQNMWMFFLQDINYTQLNRQKTMLETLVQQNDLLKSEIATLNSQIRNLKSVDNLNELRDTYNNLKENISNLFKRRKLVEFSIERLKKMINAHEETHNEGDEKFHSYIKNKLNLYIEELINILYNVESPLASESNAQENSDATSQENSEDMSNNTPATTSNGTLPAGNNTPVATSSGIPPAGNNTPATGLNSRTSLNPFSDLRTDNQNDQRRDHSSRLTQGLLAAGGGAALVSMLSQRQDPSNAYNQNDFPQQANQGNSSQNVTYPANERFSPIQDDVRPSQFSQQKNRLSRNDVPQSHSGYQEDIDDNPVSQTSRARYNFNDSFQRKNRCSQVLKSILSKDAAAYKIASGYVSVNPDGQNISIDKLVSEICG